MIKVEFFITVFSIILQIAVVYYGWKMLRVAHYLNTWKIGWIHFVIASFLILSRRVIWSVEFYTGHDIPGTVEAMLTIFVSVCFLWFVSSMKMVFDSAKINGIIESEGIPVLTPDQHVLLRIDALEQFVELEMRLKQIREKGSPDSKNKRREEEDKISSRILAATEEKKKEK